MIVWLLLGVVCVVAGTLVQYAKPTTTSRRLRDLGRVSRQWLGELASRR